MSAARGPAPNTVNNSSETTVGSAVPQRASAAAYSRPVHRNQNHQLIHRHMDHEQSRRIEINPKEKKNEKKRCRALVDERCWVLGIKKYSENNKICYLLQGVKEWKRTHLRKSARGCIYGTPEGRQCEEGALKDKVDERIKRLKFQVFPF